MSKHFHELVPDFPPLPASPLSRNETLNILMQKYSLMRTEIMANVARYKAHPRNFSIGIAAVGALMAYAVRSSTTVDSKGTLLGELPAFWIFASFATTSLVNYLAYDVLDTQYNLNALAGRAGALEKMINSLSSNTLLLWESSISDVYWQLRSPMRGVINPNIVLTFFIFVVLGIGIFSIPVFALWGGIKIPKAGFDVFGLQIQYLWLCLAYSAVSAALLLRVAVGVLMLMKPKARRIAERESFRYFRLPSH